MDKHEAKEVGSALVAFKLAKMKVARIGMPEVDKLLVKAETLLVRRVEALKKALWEDTHHEPGSREDQSKGGRRRVARDVLKPPEAGS